MHTDLFKKKLALPKPSSSDELSRWEATRRRRRVLLGEWEQDLNDYISRHLGTARQGSWGPPSQALNLFKSIINQLAVIYDQDPLVSNDELLPEQAEYVESLMLWSKAKHHSKLVLGLRESLIRIHWTPGNHVGAAGFYLRLVTPDYVEIETSNDSPNNPVMIREALIRTDPRDEQEYWFFDEWDIRDPSNPTFKICESEGGKDVTHLFIEDETYSYIDDDGRPFLPWVLYHAEDTGRLFDCYGWNELLSGTYELALLWSYWVHIVKDASWAQKYGINVRLSGTSLSGDGRAERASIETDPSSLLMFEGMNGEAASLGNFVNSTDPKLISESIIDFSSVIIDNIGLTPSDYQKTVSESGVAIKLKRESIRRMQKMSEVSFRKSDEELLTKVSMINNLFTENIKLPVTGWHIEYQSLTEDNDEIKSKLELNKSLLDLGLITMVDFIQRMNPGLSREDAANKLLSNIEEDAMFSKIRRVSLEEPKIEEEPIEIKSEVEA